MELARDASLVEGESDQAFAGSVLLGRERECGADDAADDRNRSSAIARSAPSRAPALIRRQPARCAKAQNMADPCRPRRAHREFPNALVAEEWRRPDRTARFRPKREPHARCRRLPLGPVAALAGSGSLADRASSAGARPPLLLRLAKEEPLEFDTLVVAAATATPDADFSSGAERELDELASRVVDVLRGGSFVGHDPDACSATGEQQCDGPRNDGSWLPLAARRGRLRGEDLTAALHQKHFISSRGPT
jgi:hypothetical protein